MDNADDDLTGESTEGVRIIGAEEAAEAIERGDVVSRRTEDQPKYGDRPARPPAGPRPTLRFPLDASSDPTQIEKPSVRPPEPRVSKPVTGPVDMPHWTEPATGEVPRVVIGDDDETDDLEAWSSFATSTPRWRNQDDPDWAEAGFEDPSELADEDTRIGALDTSDRPSDEELFSFDELDDVGFEPEPEPEPAPQTHPARPRRSLLGRFLDPGTNEPDVAAAPDEPVDEEPMTAPYDDGGDLGHEQPLGLTDDEAPLAPAPSDEPAPVELGYGHEPFDDEHDVDADEEPEPVFPTGPTAAAGPGDVDVDYLDLSDSGPALEPEPEPERLPTDEPEEPHRWSLLSGWRRNEPVDEPAPVFEDDGLADDGFGDEVFEPAPPVEEPVARAPRPSLGRRLFEREPVEEPEEPLYAPDPAALREFDDDLGESLGPEPEPEPVRRRISSRNVPVERPAYGAAPVGGGERNLTAAAVVGVGLVAVALLATALGPVVLCLLVAAILVLCAGEYFQALRQAGYEPVALVGLVTVGAAPLAAFWRPGVGLYVVLVLGVLACLGTFVVGAGGQGHLLDSVAVTVLGIVWIGIGGGFAGLMLAVNHGSSMVWAAIIATVANDIGAYATGRAIGTKSFSDVSPGKTVEGVVGGGVVTVVASLMLVGFVPGLAPFDSVGHALALGVVVAVVAPIGDLCQSAVKRDLGRKDMGTLLPGHGGVFDRFDAMLFVLPAVFFLATRLGIFGA